MYKFIRIINSECFIKQQLMRNMSVATAVNRTENQLKHWQEIPGPLSLPIIGQLLHFLPGGWLHKRTMEMQELLYKNYGPIVRLDSNFGIPTILYIFDPEAALTLYRNEEPMPVRPGFDSFHHYRRYYFNKNNEDPEGLVLDDGESWKRVRSIVSPIMLLPKTIKKYCDSTAEIAEEMVNRMKVLRHEKNRLENDLYTEITSWALESVSSVALGNRINCFDPNLPDDAPAKKMVKIFHDVLLTLEDLDFKPSIWKHIPTATYKKGMQVYTETTKLNEHFINKAIEEMQSRGETSNREKGILEKLLDIDRDVAMIMTHDILFVGVDTTTNTTMALMYLLAANPETQKKLREEIAMKQDKTYLKACIKETFRLIPVTSGIFRKTTKDHDVLGYRIPKDMCIMVGHQNMCVMEEQFPRPSEFIPERWFVDKSDPLYHGNAHRFAYAPFGMGARSCIGRRIAEQSMETFITKVVENFQIEWIGPPPTRTRIGVINYIHGPYNFNFKDI